MLAAHLKSSGVTGAASSTDSLEGWVKVGNVNEWGGPGSKRRVTGTVSKDDGTGKMKDFQVAVVVIRGMQPGQWYALGARCPHAGIDMSVGLVLLGKKVLKCGGHGMTFDLDSGISTAQNAGAYSVPVWKVKEGEDGSVYIASRGAIQDIPSD